MCQIYSLQFSTPSSPYKRRSLAVTFYPLRSKIKYTDIFGMHVVHETLSEQENKHTLFCFRESSSGDKLNPQKLKKKMYQNVQFLNETQTQTDLLSFPQRRTSALVPEGG